MNIATASNSDFGLFLLGLFILLATFMHTVEGPKERCFVRERVRLVEKHHSFELGSRLAHCLCLDLGETKHKEQRCEQLKP